MAVARISITPREHSPSTARPCWLVLVLTVWISSLTRESKGYVTMTMILSRIVVKQSRGRRSSELGGVDLHGNMVFAHGFIDSLDRVVN